MQDVLGGVQWYWCNIVRLNKETLTIYLIFLLIVMAVLSWFVWFIYPLQHQACRRETNLDRYGQNLLVATQ